MKKSFLAKSLLVAMSLMLMGCGADDIVETYTIKEEIVENVKDEEIEDVKSEVKTPVSEVIYPAGTYKGTLLDAYVDENGEYFGKFNIAAPIYISMYEFEQIKQMKTGDTFVFPDADSWPEDVVWTFYKYSDFYNVDAYIFTPNGEYVFDDEKWSQYTGYNVLLDETVYLVSEEFKKGDKIGVYYRTYQSGSEISPVCYDADGPEKTVTLHMDATCRISIIDADVPGARNSYWFKDMYNDPTIEAGSYNDNTNYWRKLNMAPLTIRIEQDGDVTFIEENYYS